MPDKSRPEGKQSPGSKPAEKNQLAVPPSAAEDAKAFELVRAWVAQGDLHVSLQMGGWDDPTAWGVVLADLVRHVARFYQEQKRLNPEDTIERIRAAMEAELDGEEGEMENDLVQ